MPRLRHTETGVVVSTSDRIAARLGGYEPASERKQEPKQAPRKSPRKADDE